VYAALWALDTMAASLFMYSTGMHEIVKTLGLTRLAHGAGHLVFL
jgi:hypothetical protein